MCIRDRDTTLAQIIQMVSDAAATKAPIAKIADRVSGVFVPVVITLAVITTIVWLLAGQTVGFALARGISVLVISCPCALGLADVYKRQVLMVACVALRKESVDRNCVYVNLE